MASRIWPWRSDGTAGPWWSGASKRIPRVGKERCWSWRVAEVLHVLPKSRHHHHTGRMQPLFTGEQRWEGIWLLLLWQGSLRSSPASGGEVPAAPPAPCAALGNRFLFFFQLHFHQRLHWFARGNPIPVTTGPPRCHPRGAEPVFGHGECHGAFLARGDLGEILSMRPSPSWLSM